MSKRVTKIKIMTERDKELLKQLANTGVSSVEQAYNCVGVNSNRLQRLEKSGYIKIETIKVRNGGKAIKIARLDKVGKKYCEQQLNVTNFYKTSLNQTKHDLKLTDVYYTLEPDQRETWKTESQIIKEYKMENDIKHMHQCVDAIAQINGEVVAIEVIGEKYTEKQIEQKREIANHIADRIIEI